MTVESKNGVSSMLLNKKAVRSINSFGNEEPLKNANPGRLKDKKRLIYIRPRQGNEFIIENEDDQLIQTWRKRVDEFVSKCSRRPQPTVTRRKTRTKKVNDRLGRSANIYQRIHRQTEREIGPWIPEYDSDEQSLDSV